MTANVDTLLGRLEGVQQQGNGWRARCPACGGKSRKLSITGGDDGRILLHCFAGCEAVVVVQAVGLTIADLFPERLAADTPDERRRRQRLAREAQWGAALDTLDLEAGVVAVAARYVLEGQDFDWNDFQRLCAAIDRIHEARAILRGTPRRRGVSA